MQITEMAVPAHEGPSKILFKYMLEGIAFITKIVAPYNFQLCRLLIEYILK